MENRIYINLSFDSIYESAICQAVLSADEKFSVRFRDNADLVSLNKGMQAGDRKLVSTRSGDRHCIEFGIVGLIRERPIAGVPDSTGVSTYGMQYFPFISSLLSLNFDIFDGAPVAMTVALPDIARVLWFRNKVTFEGQQARIGHSHGENESIYVFSWSNVDRSSSGEQGTNLVCDIPIRIGGKEYLRIFYFPIFYYLLYLIGVALLALQDKPNLTFTSLGAAWVLMMRLYTQSNPPQFNTLLRDIYGLAGLFLFFWAIAWENWELNAVWFSIPVTLFLCAVWWISGHFKREGELPRLIGKSIFKLRQANEMRNAQ